MTSKNISRVRSLEKKLLPTPMFDIIVTVWIDSNKEAVSYTILKPEKKHINLLPDEYDKCKDDLASLNWESL